MTKVDDLESYIRNGKEFLSTYSIRKLLAEVKDLGFSKYACEEVLKRFRHQTNNKTNQTPKKKNRSSQPISPKIDALRFIDDPDELLLSTAIRELNKPSPDPRWATILINCKKENISTKTEVIDQFKQLSIQARVNILKGLSQKTP